MLDRVPGPRADADGADAHRARVKADGKQGRRGLGRRGRRLTAVSVVALAVGVIGPQVSTGQGAVPLRQALRAAGSPGSLSAVAAGRGGVWTIGSTNVRGVSRTFIAHQARGHWRRFKKPTTGEYGAINVVAESPKGSVWLGGDRQQGGGSIQDFPKIWHWNGKKFVAVHLPGLAPGAVSVSSVSASSNSNVWAAGPIWPAADTLPGMLHFNGKRWSFVTFPVENNTPTVSVSTSSPDNAWATDGTEFFHWSGKSWVVAGSAPVGYDVQSLVTDSPTRVYALASNDSTYRQTIFTLHGTNWSPVAYAKHAHIDLRAIALSGKSVWGISSTGGTIIHSTGGAFHVQEKLGSHFSLEGISAISPRKAYVAGFYENPETEAGTTYLAEYNGHKWKGVSSRS